MPDIVTHRYDPARGACRNLCALSDTQASQILDRLRRETRPNLKADYLACRRVTEAWLTEAANALLQRAFDCHPAYFFLGDFSWLADPSRPASLILPLASLPPNATTFTLGDSMSVAAHPARRLYKLDEMLALFADGEAVAAFGLSDRWGFQKRFIEVQLWDVASIAASAATFD